MVEVGLELGEGETGNAGGAGQPPRACLSEMVCGEICHPQRVKRTLRAE